MEIQTIMAVNAYRILNSLKTGQMNDETLKTIWDDIKNFRPIAETYDKKISMTVQELQNEEFMGMQARLQTLNQKKSQEGYTITEEDKTESNLLNTYFNNLDIEAKQRFNKLSEEMVGPDFEKIDTQEFLKVIKNSDLKMEAVTALSWLLK